MEKKFRLIPVSELFEIENKRQAELEELVYFQGNGIILKKDYYIALDRCNTHAKIIGWIAHLWEKNWVTKDILMRFVELATRYHKLSFH